MSDKAERQKRKAYLLSQIQQQRLDLSASRRDWIDASRTQNTQSQQKFLNKKDMN